MKRTGIIFGATGLVGSFLLEELVKNAEYENVIVVGRSEPDLKNNKIIFIKNDLISLEDISDKIIGNDIFCSLGTTIKKAGSQKEFEKVDLQMPVTIAKIAEKNNIKNFAVVSSMGANADSRNFYLRTKGRMENEVLRFKIEKINILRPGLILGPRKEYRFGENISKIIMPLFNPFLVGRMKKYRSVHAISIAKTMIKLALSEKVKVFYDSFEISQIAKKY